MSFPAATSSAPLRPISFGNPAVHVERRHDGTIYLRPKTPLGDYPVRLTDRLHHWANAEPDRVFMAERVAANAPLTNFAVLQALPMIADANPQTGLLMESLMATVAQSDKEAKRRIRDFLDRKTAKVKPT